MDLDLISLAEKGAAVAGALGTIGGFLWGGYKWIMKPIRRIMLMMQGNVVLLNTNSEKLNKALDKIENEITPFVNSIKREFSENSGKTLKDQLIRIENGLRINDMRVKAIAMNLVNDGIYECDGEGKCTWVNKALAELWGMDKEEMLGAGWLSAIKAEDREETWQVWQYAIKNNIPYEAEYIVMNKKTGEKIPVRTVAFALRDIKNNTVSLLGTVVRVKKI